MNKQVQTGGDHSTNIQAGQVSINQGISYEEARQIFKDLFKANYLQLSEEAFEKAFARLEEITEKFLKKLREQNEGGIERARDPDFQYALFTVQKEYARTGDKELGDLLVDLLVDRTKYENRSILEIVLTESLSVAPKLTNDQLAALSVIFIFKYTLNQKVNSLQTLGEYLDIYIAPFAEVISKNNSCFQHLEYSGCGSISIGSDDLAGILLKKYGGLFSKGFFQDDINNQNLVLPMASSLIVRCLHDPGKLQINAIREDVLREEATKENMDKDDVEKLVQLNNSFAMNRDEVRHYIEDFRPYMKNIFDVWINSFMKNMKLTSVGIAIGHANAKKMIGEFTDLSIWIN